MVNYAEKDLLPQGLFEELQVIVGKYMSKDSDNDQVVKMKDEILESAKKFKFCNAIKYHVKQVGVYHKNRDGEGLSDVRAQSRVMVIKCGGFSLPTIRPNCVVMQENPFTKHIEKFTLEQCSKSPKYARYEPNMIRAGTLGAGHATHGFAQLLDEVPCDLPKISDNGRMSKKLCYQDKGIQSACEDGLWYDEIDYRIEVVFPMIPTIVSAALNTVSQVSLGENWHSMLMKITNQVEAAWPNPDMKEIKIQVLKSQPPRPQDVSDMADFVCKWGGLPSGMLIKELSELANIFVDPTRIVSGNFFKGLTQLALPPSNMPGEFINALVFVHAKATSHVQDDIARYFATKDVSDIAKNKDKLTRIMSADGMITRTRSTLNKSTLKPHDRLRLLAEFKEAVVEAAMQRKGSPETRSIEEIAADFAKKFADMVSGKIVAEKPEAEPTIEHEIDGRFVTYNDDGQVSAPGRIVVATKGFKVGDFVKPRKANSWCQYKIKEISDTGDVYVMPIDKIEGTVNHSELSTIERDLFCKDWHMSTTKIEIMEDFPKNQASNDDSMTEFTLKNLVMSCMEEIIKVHPAPELRIYKSPQTCIIAMKEFALGEVVLVPGTKAISKVSSAEQAKVVVAIADGIMFKLHSNMDKQFICPFWFVTVNHQREKCNLELVTKIVNTKRPSMKDKNNNPVIPVSFQCAVNFKAIEMHAELVLYRPAAAAAVTPAKHEAPLVLAGAVKKPK